MNSETGEEINMLSCARNFGKSYKAFVHVKDREEMEIGNAISRYGTGDVESLLCARHQWIIVHQDSL
jgi:hypothetical protein